MLKLGCIANRHGELVNHRSLLKVLMNPFLRTVGLQWVSVLNPMTMKVCDTYLTFCDTPHRNLIKNLYRSWVYRLRDGEMVVRERMLY